jgi:hypothetical protein
LVAVEVALPVQVGAVVPVVIVKKALLLKKELNTQSQSVAVEVEEMVQAMVLQVQMVTQVD